MAEQAPVLWCSQCKKPFSKQSTLKRHGYYCRSNKKEPVQRRRSCTTCAKTKTSCDNALPACSRCLRKDITCKYPSWSAVKRRNPVKTRHDIPDLHGLDQDPTNTIVSAVPEQIHDIRELIPARENSMLSADIQWNLHDTATFDDFIRSTPDLNLFTTTPSHSLASAGQTPVSPSLLLPETADVAFQEQPQPASQRQRQDHASWLVSSSIPPIPNQNVRSMMQRPNMRPGADRTANLLFYTLKSYPLMLRQSTLPPFIHPSCVSFTDEGTTNEPLENCIALIHMMANGIQGSRRLFWRNVKQECERMCQNQTLGKWELLGAMQALSVYVLIRLDEGETEHNNVDHLLEKAVILIAIQLSHDDFDCHANYLSCRNTSESSWQDWVYKESRRRLAVIYRVLNKLIFFEPAAMCNMPAEFVIAPLPAKRQLWEAKNTQDWKSQSQTEPQGQISYALAVDGEIIKLDQGRLSCRDAWLPYAPSDKEPASQIHNNRSRHCSNWWAEWCSGMDGMGGLIMLVASLA